MKKSYEKKIQQVKSRAKELRAIRTENFTKENETELRAITNELENLTDLVDVFGGRSLDAEKTELEILQRRYRVLDSRLSVLKSDIRSNNDFEIAQIKDEQRFLETEINRVAGPQRSSDEIARLAQSVSGRVHQFSVGYELRSAHQSKSFQDLFGDDHEYRWTDHEQTFFQALFSGRAHPGLTTRSMNEATGSDGGLLVPGETADQIHAVSVENEVVLPRAVVMPMKGNSYFLPGLEIGNHASNIFGGFTASFTEEAGTLSENNPKVRGVKLEARKLTGFLKMSNELFHDIPGGAQRIINLCGMGLGWYRDNAFLTGSGAGCPLGVLNATCTIEVAKEDAQTASTVVYKNLTKMMSRMWAGSFQNSVWIASPTCIPSLLSLGVEVGTAGGSHVPVLKESDGKFSILTRPVIFTEKLPSVGNKGDIILADFSQYIVGLRSEMRIDLSQHVYFSTDQVAARLISRFDGRPIWNEPLTLADGSTTVSPFVTLAARTE